MKFSIGYNQDIKILGLLSRYKSNIEAFYFPIPSQYLGSGRDIPQKNNYINEIPKLILKCNALNIKSQLLLNATCEGGQGLEKNFFLKIINYIQKLKGLELKSIIVTNPIYISEIKKQIEKIEIESSVNCYVKTPEHALYLKDLGVDILTIDRDINRDIPLLKEIKHKSGLKIKIMLNEGCLRNCPFRNMHYNYLSHSRLGFKKSIDNIFLDKFCIQIYLKNPAKFFSTPFIPADALSRYTDFVDYYKLSTRVFTTVQIESCLKAYINQDFNGNLLDILDSPGKVYFDFIYYPVLKKNNFFSKTSRCDGNCKRCNYCSKLMDKAVVINSDFLEEPEKTKEREKGIKVYKRALKTLSDKNPIRLKLSRALFELKRYKEAIKYARKLIHSNYKEGNMHFLLGFCYEKIKQYKKAIEELKKAKNLTPQEPQINFSLSNCYRNTGRIKRANQELDKGFLKLKKS